MASNTRPVFRHPIQQQRTTDSQDGYVVSADLIVNAADLEEKIKIIRWNGLDIAVRRIIKLDEMQKLIGMVLDRCWNGEYFKNECVDFYLRSAVILFYTSAYLPEDEDIEYEILYGTDLFESVKECISTDQLTSIRNALKLYMTK